MNPTVRAVLEGPGNSQTSVARLRSPGSGPVFGERPGLPLRLLTENVGPDPFPLFHPVVNQSVDPYDKRYVREGLFPVGQHLMNDAQLIVCEKRRFWAVALRRRWTAEDRSPATLPLRECRNLTECEEMLGHQRAALVAIEVNEADFDDLLVWLANLPRKFPLARCVALVQDENQQRDEMLREAGVILIASARRKIGPVLGLYCRQAEQTPRREMSILQDIEASLPWNQE